MLKNAVSAVSNVGCMTVGVVGIVAGGGVVVGGVVW